MQLLATGSTIPSKIPQRKDGRTVKYGIDLQLELPFGFGNYPDKLFVSPSTELSFNSSDRELPRDMFRFKTVYNYLSSIIPLTRVTFRLRGLPR